MSDQDGVIVDPVRLDPLANVQYADYTNVQYLQLNENEMKGLFRSTPSYTRYLR